MQSKYQLKMGSGPKKPSSKLILTKLQKEVFDYCYDDINGPLNFSHTCCWVNCNGIVQYKPYEYQRHMFWNYQNFDRNAGMCGRQMGKCIFKDTNITIKSKLNNQVLVTTIGKFYNLIKNNATYIQKYNNDIDTSFNHDKKFLETIDVNDWEVETDTGWVDIKKIHKTIPYQLWQINTKSFELICADRHLVFDENMKPIFVDELYVGKKIQTKNGIEEIISIENYSVEDNMYDLELDDENHRYYTNGILSHNTISTVIYLLWYAMKYPYKEILITSYSDDSAKKNLNDIKTIYENCPMFLKRGVKSFNESTIVFDNNSKIYSRPTTSKSARGLSPAIIYCDEFAFIGRGESRQKATALQEEFYAGISPALSTSKGKLFITSTPISETDLFYNIWNNAITRSDEQGIDLPDYYGVAINDEKYSDLHKFLTEDEAQEYATNFDNASVYKIDGLGRNGFGHLFSTWRDMPGRTDEWAKKEELTQGTERFQREYNCLDGNTFVTIMDDNEQVFSIPLKLLYEHHMV